MRSLKGRSPVSRGTMCETANTKVSIRAAFDENTCKFCFRPLVEGKHDMNNAHTVCNAEWDSRVNAGNCGKCNEPFRTPEDADMKVHDGCYEDGAPYAGYAGP